MDLNNFGKLLGTALFFITSSAWAAPIVLTFEGLGDDENIANYYDGGLGGNGSGPGPNYGITFATGSLALISKSAGGTGKFSNAPSGDTVAFFQSGPGDILNKPSGFDTGFSFFYADQKTFTGRISVYSGLDGTGTRLATLSLSPTPNPYNVFLPVGVSFSGTAESVIFGGSAKYIGFDNITLGSATAISSVPLPASLPLFGLALTGLASFGSRKSRRAKKV